MSVCAVCGKLLTNSESGRRPCCQAHVHSECIRGYAKYCHNSGNPNPSCPVCKQQAEDLQSKIVSRESILSHLRKSSDSSSASGEGILTNGNPNHSNIVVSPKSPHVAQAEALILKAEQRSNEKERQVADAQRQVAEEQERLSRRNRITSERRSEQSRSPNATSQTTAAFKKTIATLEEKLAKSVAEANQKQLEFDKRLQHEISERKKLQSEFDSLADYSAKFQRDEDELSTQLELQRNEYAAVKSRLFTAESQLSILNEQHKKLQEQNAANEALLRSNQGVSQKAEEDYQQRLSSLSKKLSAAQSSLESVAAEKASLLEAHKRHEKKCAELEASNAKLLHRLHELEQNENLMKSSESDSQSQVAHLKAVCSDFQSELDEARQEINGLKDTKYDLESKLKNLEESEENLQNQNTSLGFELQRIQEQLNQARHSTQNANQNLSRDKARIQQLETALLEAQEEYDKQSNELSQVKAKMEEINSAHDTEIEQLVSKVDSLKEALESSKSLYNDSLSSQSILQDTLNTANERYSQMEKSLSTQLESLREDKERMDSILSAVQSSFAESEILVSNLSKEKSELQSDISHLREKEKSHQEDLLKMTEALRDSKTTIELAHAKEKKLEASITEMAQSLRKLEENYRSVVLVNTQLEDRLDQSDSVIKENEESWSSYCENLKKQAEANSAQLKDMNETLKEQHSEITAELKSLKQANIDLEDEIRSVSESLVICETERSAATDELEKSQQRHESELHSLKDVIKDLQTELQKVQDHSEQVENENNLLQEVLKGLRDDMETAQNLTKKDLADAEMMNSKLSDKIEALQEKIATMTMKDLADQDNYKSSMEECSQKLEQCLQELTIRETQLRLAEEEISRLSSALEDSCAKLSDFDSASMARSQECDHLKRQLTDLATRVSDLMGENDHLSKDNTRLLHMFERCDEECQTLKEQLVQENKRQNHISEMFLRSINAQKTEFSAVQEELLDVKTLLARTLEERAIMSQQARSFEELFPILQSQFIDMNKLQNDHSRVCALLEAMEDSKSDLIQQMEMIRDHLSEKNGDLDRLRVENSTLKTTIAELQQQAENDCKEVAALHHQLTQTESERVELAQMQLKSSISGPIPRPREASPALNRDSKTAQISAEPGTRPLYAESLQPASMRPSRDASRERSPASPRAETNAQRIPESSSSVAIHAADAAAVRSRSVSAKPSRDSSPALSRASTTVKSSAQSVVGLALDAEPALSRTVSDTNSPPAAAAAAAAADSSVADIDIISSESDSIAPSLDIENSSAPTSDHSMPSSPRPSPPSHHRPSQPASPRSSTAPDRPAPAPPLAGRVPGPVRPGRAPVRPTPMMRRIVPAPIRRSSSTTPSRPMDAAPSGISPHLDTDLIIERSSSSGDTAAPMIEVPKSAPNRPPATVSRSLRPPGRPVPFRPQPLRRAPIAPNRLNAPVPSDASIAIAAAAPMEQEAESTASSPRSTALSRQPSSSNIDAVHISRPITPQTASRLESPESASNVPMTSSTAASLRTGPSPGHPRPMPAAPMRPSRPGRMAPGPSRSAIRPLPTLERSPDEAVAVSSGTPTAAAADDESKPNEKPDDKPSPAAAESARPAPIRPGPLRSGPMGSRRAPGMHPGRRPPNAPPARGPSSVVAAEPSAAGLGGVRPDSAGPKAANRSREASPQPSIRSSSPDVVRPSTEGRSRPLSHQPLRSRDSASDSAPRSRSMLQKLLSSSSGPDAGDVEKVEFVYDQGSQTWVPEGSAPAGTQPDHDSASNALHTVQRLRSQVHQTREQISHANADLPESKPLPSDQATIPEEKWIQACELLRESRLRLAKDDALRLRIEVFLADAGSGGLPLPDAVSELEELLETVQTHDQERSRSCCGQLFTLSLMISVMVAIVAVAMYALYPVESQQAFDTLQAFVMKSIASFTGTEQRSPAFDMGDYDDSDRLEL